MTAHACPYPRLAEQDRGVCELEQILFSELLGQDVRLSKCRLDGGRNCQFVAGDTGPEGPYASRIFQRAYAASIFSSQPNDAPGARTEARLRSKN